MSAERRGEDKEHTTSEASGSVSAAFGDDTLVIEELLVEEISIDGMCGVY